MRIPDLRCFWKKGTALAVSLSLAISVPAMPAHAEPRSPVNFSALPEISQITIPEALGKIEAAGAGNGKPVILIQDAHAVPEAQRHIADLIRHLHESYGVSDVAFEGASSRIDARFFLSFPDRKVFEKVFQGYMERSELTGVNSAALHSGVHLRFQGVEDWNLYEEGTRTFLLALDNEPALLRRLDQIKEELGVQKKESYSPELATLDDVLGRFWENEIGLEEVLPVLNQVTAPPAGSALEALCRELLDKNKTISLIEEETRRIAELAQKKISEKGSRETQMEFNEKLQDFKTGVLSAKEFAHYLHSAAPGIEFSPEVFSAIQETRRLKDIDGTQFFQDLELYIESAKQKLYRNEAEKAIDRKDAALRLAHKLIRLELTRNDLETLRTIQTKGSEDLGAISALIGKAGDSTRFYELAEQREEIFFKRIRVLLKSDLSSSAVFVAGGFHARGMTERLSAAGIPWALVTPAISDMPESIPYREHMRGEVSWKNYFEVNNGRINLYEAFVRAARDRLVLEAGGASGVTLKAWRDQIVRDLAAEGRIEDAGDYTRFLDEETRRKSASSAEPEWKANAERFLGELRKLESAGRLNQQSVSTLLRQMTSAELVPTNILIPGAATTLYLPDASGVFDAEAFPGLFADAEPAGEFRSELRPTDNRDEEAFRRVLGLFAAKTFISADESAQFFDDPKGALIRLRVNEPAKLALSVKIAVKVKGVPEERSVTLEQLLENAAKRREPQPGTTAPAPAAAPAPVNEFANLDLGPAEPGTAARRTSSRKKGIPLAVWIGGGVAALAAVVISTLLLVNRGAPEPKAPEKKAPERIERPVEKERPRLPDPAPVPRVPTPLLAPAALPFLDAETAAYYQKEAGAYNNYVKEETGLIRFIYTTRDGKVKSAYALIDHIAAGEKMTYSQPLAMGALLNIFSQQAEGNLPKTVKDPLSEIESLLEFFDAWHQRFGVPVSWIYLEKNPKGEYVAMLSPRLQGETKIGHSSEDYLGFLGNLLVADGALKAVLDDPTNAGRTEQIRKIRTKILQVTSEMKNVFKVMVDPVSGSLWAGVHIEEGKALEPVKTRVIDRFSEDMEATFLAVALGFLPESVIEKLQIRPIIYKGAAGSWTASSSVYGAAFQMPGYNNVINLRRHYKVLDDLYDGTEAAYIDLYADSKGHSYYPGSAFGSGGRYFSHAGHPKLSEVAGVKFNMIIPGFAAISGERSRRHMQKVFGQTDLVNPATGVPFESLYIDDYRGERILVGVPYHSAAVAAKTVLGFSHRFDPSNDISVFIADEGHHGVPQLQARIDDIVRKKFRLADEFLEFTIIPAPETLETGEKAPVRVLNEGSLPAKIVDGKIDVFTNLMPKAASIGIFTASPSYEGNFAWLNDESGSVIFYNLAANKNETSGAFWKTRRIDPRKFGTAEIILGGKADVPAAMGADITLEFKDAKGLIGEKIVIDRALIKPDAKILVDLTALVEAAVGRGPVTEISLTFKGKDTKGNIVIKDLILHEAEFNLLGKTISREGAVGIYTEKARFAGNLTTVTPAKTLKVDYNVNRENKLTGVFIKQAYDPRLYRQMQIQFVPDGRGDLKLPAAFIEIKDEKGVITQRFPIDIPANFRKTNTIVVDLEKVREEAVKNGRGPVTETNLIFPIQDDKPAAGSFTVKSIYLSSKAVTPEITTFFNVDLAEEFHPLKVKVLNKRDLTAAVLEKIAQDRKPPARQLRSAVFLRSNLQFVPPAVRFFQLHIAARSEEIANQGDLENWLPFAKTYEDVYVGLYLRYWVRELNEVGPRKNWRLEGQGPVSHYAERARKLVDQGKSLEELRDEILQLKPEARSELRDPGAEETKLILASSSARRKELLSALGFKGSFEAKAGDVTEVPFTGESAESFVSRMAVAKAKAVAATNPGIPVVGSDTVLADHEGKILQEPGTAERNLQNLRNISGREVKAHTAVAVIARDGTASVRVGTSIIQLKDLNSSPELLNRIAEKYFHRAGGIDVQDPENQPHERILGSFSNILGFPLAIVHDLLTEAGIISGGNLRSRLEKLSAGNPAPPESALPLEDAIRKAGELTEDIYEQYILAAYLMGSITNVTTLLEYLGERRTAESAALLQRQAFGLFKSPPETTPAAAPRPRRPMPKKYIAAALAGVVVLGFGLMQMEYVPNPFDGKETVWLSDFDSITKRAEQIAARPHEDTEIIPAPDYDFATPPSARGLVYQEAVLIRPRTHIFDVKGTAAVPYPRRGTHSEPVKIYRESTGPFRFYTGFNFDPANFDYSHSEIQPPLPAVPPPEASYHTSVGFSAQRKPGDYPQLALFSGNGYGRFAAMGGPDVPEALYGASERGFLQLGTLADPRAAEQIPEVFPRLKEVFVSRPSGKTVVVHQIYTHPDAVMVRRLVIDMQAETYIEVTGRIIPRPGAKIMTQHRFGWGFSSLYWKGKAEGAVNRDAAHDSDLATLSTLDGRTLTYPIAKPPEEGKSQRVIDLTEAAGGHVVTGWSLEQTDQSPEHFIPNAARYDERASFYITDTSVARVDRATGERRPLATQVQLILLAPRGEDFNNVVLSQTLDPKTSIGDSERIEFSYRMTVKRAEPQGPRGADARSEVRAVEGGAESRSELRMSVGNTQRTGNVILETRRIRDGHFVATRPVEKVNAENPWEVQQYARELYNAIAEYAKAVSPEGREINPQEIQVKDEFLAEISALPAYQADIRAVMGARASEGFTDQLDLYRLLARMRGKRFIPELPVYPEIVKEPAYHIALLVDPQRSNVDSAILRGLLGNSNIAVDVIVGITAKELRTRLNSSIYGEFLSNRQVRYNEEEEWIEILGKRIRVVKSPSNLTVAGWNESGINTFVSTYDIADDYKERMAKAVFGSTRLDVARFVSMHDIDLFDFKEARQNYVGEPYRGKDSQIESSLVRVPVRLLEALRASRAFSKTPYVVDLEYQVSPMFSETILDQSGKKRSASRNIIPADANGQRYIRRALREETQAHTKRQDDIGTVRVTSAPVPVGDRVVINFAMQGEAADQFLRNLGFDPAKIDWKSEAAEDQITRAFIAQAVEKLHAPFVLKHKRQVVNTDARFESEILVDAEGVVTALEQPDGKRSLRISLPIVFNRELQDVRSFVEILTEMNRRRNLPARETKPDQRLSAFGQQARLSLEDGTLPPEPLQIPAKLGVLLEKPVTVGILGSQGQIGSRLGTIDFESLNFRVVAGSGPSVEAQVDSAQMSSITGPIISNGREVQVRSTTYPKAKNGLIGELTFGDGLPFFLMDRYRDLTQIPWAQQGVEVVIDATGAFVKPEQLVGHLNAGRAEKNGAQAVLLTAPFKGGEAYPTIVYGVNHGQILPFMEAAALPNIFSNASCTTNCMALMTQYVNRLPAAFTKHLREKYGVKVTVSDVALSPSLAVHAPTNSNPLIDLGEDKSAMGTFFYSSGVTKAIKQLGLTRDPWPKAFTGFAYRIGGASTSISHLPVVLQLQDLNDADRAKLAEKSKEITLELISLAKQVASEMEQEEAYRGLFRSVTDEEGFTSEVAAGTTDVVLDWQQVQANFRPDVGLVSLSLNGFYDNVEQYTAQLARTLDQIVLDLRRVQAKQAAEERLNVYRERYEAAFVQVTSFNQIPQAELGLENNDFHTYQAVILALLQALELSDEPEQAETHAAALGDARTALLRFTSSPRVAEVRDELESTALDLSAAARSEMRSKKGSVPESLDLHVEQVIEILDISSLGGSDRFMIQEPLQRALAILKTGTEPEKIQKAHSEIMLARQAVPSVGYSSVEKLVDALQGLQGRLKSLMPPPPRANPFGRGRKSTKPSADNRSELRADVSPELGQWIEKQGARETAASGIREFARFYEDLPQPMRDALSAEMRALADGEREIPRSAVQLARRAWPKGMVQSLDSFSRGDLSVKGLSLPDFLKEEADLQESSPEAFEGTVLFAKTIFKIHDQLEKRSERNRFIIALAVLAMIVFGKLLIEFAAEAAVLWGVGKGQQAIERRIEENRRGEQIEKEKIAEETAKLVSRIVNADEDLKPILEDLAALERGERIDVLQKTAGVYKDKAGDLQTRARILQFYERLLVKSLALERDTQWLRLDAFFSLRQFTDPEVVRLIGEGLKRSTELEYSVNPKFRSGEENFQISVIFYLSDINTDEALEPVRDMFPPRLSKGEYEEKDYRVKSVIERALQKKDGTPSGQARSELRAFQYHTDANRVRRLRFSPAEIKNILREPDLKDQDLRQAIEWRLDDSGFKSLAEDLAKRLTLETAGSEGITNGTATGMREALRLFLPETFENSVDSYFQRHGISRLEELDRFTETGEPGLVLDYYVFRDNGTAYIHIVDDAFGKIGAETSEEKIALRIKGVTRIGGRHTGLLVLDRYFQRNGRFSPYYNHFKVGLLDRIEDLKDTVRGTVVEVAVDTQLAGGRSELRLAAEQTAIVLAPEQITLPALFREEDVAAGIEEAVRERGLDRFAEDLLDSISELSRRIAADFNAQGGTDAAGALRYRNLQAVLGMMQGLARGLADQARAEHGDIIKDLHAGASLAVAVDEQGRIDTKSGINITPEALASALERYKFLLSKVNFVSDGQVAEVLRNIKIPNKRVARDSFISGEEILSLIGEAQIKNDNVWQLDIAGDAAKLDPFTAELLLNLMILVGGLVNYSSGAAEIRKAMESGNPVAELLKQYPGLAMILNQENLQFAMENGRPTLRFQARILQELLSQEAIAVSA